MPFLLAVNKGDRRDEWELDDSNVQGALPGGMDWIETSAKTGAGVAEAFQRLAAAMLG